MQISPSLYPFKHSETFPLFFAGQGFQTSFLVFKRLIHKISPLLSIFSSLSKEPRIHFLSSVSQKTDSLGFSVSDKTHTLLRHLLQPRQNVFIERKSLSLPRGVWGLSSYSSPLLCCHFWHSEPLSLIIMSRHRITWATGLSTPSAIYFPRYWTILKGCTWYKLRFSWRRTSLISITRCVFSTGSSLRRRKSSESGGLGEDWPLHSTILGSFTPSPISRQESVYPLHPWVHWLFRRLPIAPTVPLGACLTHWGFIHIPRQSARVKTEQSAETAASLKGWHWLSSRRVKNYGNGRKK